MKQAYRNSSEEIMAELNTSENGLSAAQVEASRVKYGSNALGEEKRVSPLRIFLSQFNDFLIWILLAAAILSLILAKAESAIVIAVVVLVNAILGTVQHLKAEESLTALKALSSPSAKVIRSGETITINSQDLVVGDILLIETGDFIAADGRIINEHSLKSDESALTGESVSTEKDNKTLDGSDLGPGDQSNMVFSGTHITYGRGLAVVTSVGLATELGKIASMLEQAKEKKTPLQISLDNFGRKLAVIILAISAIIFALSIYRGRPMLDAVMFSVSLAVAAIPEALSSIVTIVLAIGTRRMARENAIIRRLHAVEGLGSVSVICSDKTGTLTQNKMTIKQAYVRNRLVSADGLDLTNSVDNKLLRIAMLCNDSITTDRGEIGDPTELALVDWGEVYEQDELKMREQYTRISELPFDSERKLMSTLQNMDGKRVMMAKGGVDVMLRRVSYIDDSNGGRQITDDDISRIEQINHKLSSEGLRVLAFAAKDYDSDLLFINLVTDSLPAIAIGLEAPDKSVMNEPPRDIREPLLNKQFASTVLFQGLLIAISTIMAFYIGLTNFMSNSVANGVGSESARMTAATMAFAVLCFARLIHGFNSRTQGPLRIKRLFSNRFSWIAFLSGTTLLAAVLFIAPLQTVFETVMLTAQQYGAIAVLAFLPTFVIQIYRRLKSPIQD